MANERFPDYPSNPVPEWVNNLRASNRAEYERVRASDIEKYVERITEVFRSVEEFDGVSDEAIGYIALRFATPMRDCFEKGIQVGEEGERKRLETEKARRHSIEIAQFV